MKASANQRVDRRERLLTAAAELFARWGFDKTSVDEIARESGVSKGAVYLEFFSKEEVFHAVLYRELLLCAEDWLERFEKDPGEWSFARMFQHSLAAIQASPLVRALLTRDKRIFGGFLRTDSVLFSSVIAMRAELFQQLQDIGAMRADIPAASIAYLMSVIGYGLIASDEVIPDENKISFEDALVGLGLLLDRGLAPERAKNKKQARAFIVATIEKMKALLHAGEVK